MRDVKIITAGRTGPNKLLCFGGGDQHLDDHGRTDMQRLLGAPITDVVRCGPETYVRESALILAGGIAERVVVDDGLESLRVGSWDGLLPEEVDRDQLRQFFTDVTSAPHGGESVAAFVERIAEWRNGIDDGDVSTIVVAMPVGQALMAPDATSYFGCQTHPASIYRLPPVTSTTRPRPPSRNAV